MVDYRKFRLNQWNSEEFGHIRLLLFWPVYGFLFLFVERLGVRDHYYPVHCALDDAIPFCEYFMIPYLFWFLFLTGMIVYTFFFDVKAFRRMMYFIILTYSATIAVYLFFPTCQNLRPAVIPRSNVLARFVLLWYQFDTNTNVCPSIHVLGSLAAMFGAWDSRAFRAKGWKIGFGVCAFLISISTVFVKQHSILDVFAACGVGLIGYAAVYHSACRIPLISGSISRE